MRMRYLSPLLVTLFGLLLSARAQEASSFAKARGKLTTRSYPVADLIVPVSAAVANPVIHLPPPGATCAKEPCCAEKVQAACPLVKAAVSAPCPAPAYCAPAQCGEEKPTCEGRLIKLIQNTVSPHCWSCLGGPATIDYYPLGMALVVNAEPDVHEQVMGLLNGLRRLQDVCVAVEMRMVTVPEGMLERLGLDLKQDGLERIGIDFNAGSHGQPPATQGPGKMPAAFLNDVQVFQFLETIQSDPRTTIHMSPKVTVLNGQTATVQIRDLQAFCTDVKTVQAGGKIVFTPTNRPVSVGGVSLSVRPAVSADRRLVQLKLKAALDSPEPAEVPQVLFQGFVSPVCDGQVHGRPRPVNQTPQQPKVTTRTVDKFVTVPDGGTVVIGGMKFPCKAEQECATPILSKLPYVNRLFKNVGSGCETETVVILVTPRVIVQKEEEHPRPPLKAVRIPVPPPPMMAAPRPMPVPPAAPVQPAPYIVQTAAAPAPTPVDRAGTSFRAKQVAKLMEMYHEACAGGHHDEARKLATFALELDPTCFSRSRR